MNTTITTNRLVWVDVLRSVAILGVLVIHALFSVFARTDFVGGASWWLANILVSFSRMSIPIFIMLSGYLVLSKAESVQQTLSRTWWRLGIPFLFWSIFYVWWDWFFFQAQPNFAEYGKQLVFGNMFILYFLIILIGLYVVSPFIRPFLRVQNTQNLVRAALGMLAVSGVLLIAQYVLLHDHSIWNSFSMWIPYLGYYLIGYLIGSADKKPGSNVVALSMLFSAGYLLTLFLSYQNLVWLRAGDATLWQSPNGGVEYFGEYFSMNVIVMSVSFFALLVTLRDQIARLPNISIKVAAALSEAAFGMFLFHSVILNILDNKFGYDIQLITGNLWIYIIQKLLLTVFLSYVSVWLFLRVPYLNNLFGAKNTYSSSK